MVWTVWSSNFSKHPFRQIAVILFILFFKIILVENIYSAARSWLSSVPQTAETTFSFSSVFILMLCSWPTWECEARVFMQIFRYFWDNVSKSYSIGRRPNYSNFCDLTWSEATHIVPDFTISVYSTAVHAIIFFSASFWFLCCLLLFNGIPMAKWNAKKWINKDKKSEWDQKWENYMICWAQKL